MNTQIILEADSQGEYALKAKDLTVSVTFKEGAVTVSGQHEMRLLNGKEFSSSMPQFNIRTVEATGVASNLIAEEKVKYESRIAIWEQFQSDVATALQTAFKANYDLDNPVEV